MLFFWTFYSSKNPVTVNKKTEILLVSTNILSNTVLHIDNKKKSASLEYIPFYNIVNRKQLF